ncbi:Down syndrome cell adhesion molecule-like protein Dscam2 [Varroa jacobsoni]|uniref:Down syndrome cell adhesion molecule-like protein Dscam2 n=1 Tax=Varroa jacobsoni TaxID=62625 RepID=UPI000BF77F4F|nr:Down syndrome cell adhesion molecule-like protein Dscam2 [Varroa jacobsoni]
MVDGLSSFMNSFQSVPRGRATSAAFNMESLALNVNAIGVAFNMWLNMDSLVSRFVSVILCVVTTTSAQVAPEIAPHRSLNDLSEGKRLSLICLATSGTPPISFSWSKDSAPIGNLFGVKIVHIDDFQYQLQIDKLTIEHVGNYSCNAKNIYGSDHITIPVIMKFAPQWVSINHETPIGGVAGESVQVDCRAIGHPQPTIRILRESTVIPDDQVVNGLLTIALVTSRDKGDYQCEAVNSLGKLLKTVTVSLSVPPQIAPFKVLEDLSEGKRVSLICSVTSGSPPISFSWSKGGRPVGPLTGIKIIHFDEFQDQLQIEKLRSEHVGNYTCNAKNSFGTDQMSVAVALKFKPFWRTEERRRILAVTGEKVQVDCRAVGHPEPTVKIFKGIMEINDPQLNVNGLLTIDPVSFADRGEYQCEASNSLGRISSSFTLILSVVLNFKPRWINNEPESKNAVAGNILKIDCRAIGRPQPVIKIIKDLTELTGGNITHGLLTINTASASDKGEYGCEASNSMGKISRRISLTLSAPPQISPFKVLEDLTEGRRLVLVCSVFSGSFPISYQWLKDGSPVKLLPYVQIVHAGDFQDSLQIEKLTAEHVGNYTCSAKNAFGSDQMSVAVVLRYKPRWITTGDDVLKLDSVVGDELNVDCRANGHPVPNIRISRGGSSLTSTSRLHVHNGLLTIKSISQNDKGEFICEASNSLGNITRTISLSLTVPARFKEKTSVVTSRRSETTTLKCYAVGDHPISVVWSKGNVKLDKRTSSRYQIIESITTDGLSSELRIRETDRADSALYSCHTENKFGNDDRKVKLVVKDVPGAPQDVRVKDIWSRSVSVYWTPSYDGNSPISKYIVNYWKQHGVSNRPQEFGVPSAQHFTLVRDLQPGTQYVLNVLAENSIGKSEDSRTVTFTTNDEEPEAPPLDVNALTQGPTTVLVSWKAPQKDTWNGDIEGYYIGFKPKNSNGSTSYKKVEQKNNITHEYILQGLNKGTEYEITVQAYNHAGSGPISPQRLVMTRPGEDSPDVPRLFVDAVTMDSIKVHWQLRTGGQILNYTVHHRQADGGAWLENVIVNSTDNSYALTGLRSGTTYEIFLTASNGAMKGDPSQILKIQTLRSPDILVEIFESDGDLPIYMNMYLTVPAAALALAIIVIVVSSCICCRQMKNVQQPVPPQGEMALYGTMVPQRYMDAAGNEVTVTYGTVPPVDPGAIQLQAQTVQMQTAGTATVVPTIANANTTGTWSRKEAPKNRPLPVPSEASDKTTGHLYDSAQ